MAEPIIKFEPNGKASLLSYNVPEPTTYSGTNIIELDFPDDYFTDEAKTVPEGRNSAKSMDDKELQEKISDALDKGIFDSRIFPNARTSKTAVRIKRPTTKRKSSKATTIASSKAKTNTTKTAKKSTTSTAEKAKTSSTNTKNRTTTSKKTNTSNKSNKTKTKSRSKTKSKNKKNK